eukprot:3941938-Rhodomonas_salina.1
MPLRHRVYEFRCRLYEESGRKCLISPRAPAREPPMSWSSYRPPGTSIAYLSTSSLSQYLQSLGLYLPSPSNRVGQ